AVGVDMGVQVWDVVAGKKVFTQPVSIAPDMALALRPDGAVLAGVGLGVIRLWDLATGQMVRSFRGPIHAVHTLTFSADGRRLAAAGGDHMVREWDAEAGKELHLLRHTDRALCVAFSPDGKYLASGGCDNVVRVWDAATGKEVSALRGPAGYVMGVAFSP